MTDGGGPTANIQRTGLMEPPEKKLWRLSYKLILLRVMFHATPQILKAAVKG